MTEKRFYTISHPEDLGPLWMNKDNLALCLFSDMHIEADGIEVEDVSEEVSALKQRVAELEGEVQAQRNALTLAGEYASQGDREKALEILCRFNARDNVISEIDSLRRRVAELDSNRWEAADENYRLTERVAELEKVATVRLDELNREVGVSARATDRADRAEKRVAELEATLEPFADMYDLCYLDEFDDATRCIELHRELIQVLFWKQAKNILGRDMDTNPLRADAASPENGIEEAP